MEDLERLKKLAGISEPSAEQDSMGENLSSTGTEKAQYQRKHNIRPGSNDWFKLWFSRPKLTGENPMPKNK